MTCSQPVIAAKRALEERKESGFTVILNDPFSSENVKRFALSQGCSVTVEKRGEDFYFHIQKTGSPEEGKKLRKEGRIVVCIDSDRLGIGDEALGSILMREFLEALLGLEKKPNRLLLINSGVRLSTEGSDSMETLAKLSEAGTEILSCGIYLDFYGLKDKLRVGSISNMYEITSSLLEANRLIWP
jgi:selenium metabolism protein YedF